MKMLISISLHLLYYVALICYFFGWVPVKFMAMFLIRMGFTLVERSHNMYEKKPKDASEAHIFVHSDLPTVFFEKGEDEGTAFTFGSRPQVLRFLWSIKEHWTLGTHEEEE